MSISFYVTLFTIMLVIAEPLAARINKCIYNKEKSSRIGRTESFIRSMTRKDHYRYVILVTLVLTTLISALASEEESSMSHNNFEKLQESVNIANENLHEMMGRLKAVEEHLWGGGKGDGDSETPPNTPRGPGGGTSPTGSQLMIPEEILQELSQVKERISRLEQEHVKPEEIEEIHRRIIQDQEDIEAIVEEHNMLVQQLNLSAG